MESSGLGMVSFMLLNCTGWKCVWLLITWQAMCMCEYVGVLERSPWGGDVRSEQLDASHLCNGVQNKPVLNSKWDLPRALGWETKVQPLALQSKSSLAVPLWRTDLPLSFTLCNSASVSAVLHFPKCLKATFKWGSLLEPPLAFAEL